MGVLDSLPPGMRPVVLYAAPAVAALALYNRSRKPAEEETSSTGSPTGWGMPVMPSADAIGVAQLADFESQLTAGLTDVVTTVGTLAEQVANLADSGASAPPPSTAPIPRAPAPAPVDACAGRTRCVPGYACAPAGSYAEPITMPLNLLNRPPTAQEQAQGYFTIGVQFRPC